MFSSMTSEDRTLRIPQPYKELGQVYADEQYTILGGAKTGSYIPFFGKPVKMA